MGSHQRRHDGTRQENPTCSGSGDEGGAMPLVGSNRTPNVDRRLHRNSDRDGHSKLVGGRIGVLPNPQRKMRPANVVSTSAEPSTPLSSAKMAGNQTHPCKCLANATLAPHPLLQVLPGGCRADFR